MSSLVITKLFIYRSINHIKIYTKLFKGHSYLEGVESKKTQILSKDHSCNNHYQT